MALLPGILHTIFETETNPMRFEDVCRELIAESEQLNVLPTSRTHDRGRDGKWFAGASAGEYGGVLCVTLSQTIDQKVVADLRRLRETTKARVLIYCTSRNLSESAVDGITATVRRDYKHAESVRVLGQVQLAALAERHEDVIRRHYIGELQTIETALTAPRAAGSDPEHVGLRLALLTQTGDDAKALRAAIARRLISDFLLAHGRSSLRQIAVGISTQLHLPRAVSEEYVSFVVAQMELEGLVARGADEAELTERGLSENSESTEEGGKKLLEGRAAIRAAIKNLSGHDLHDSHYDTVWKTLQDGLAQLLYEHGAAVVRAIASIASPDGDGVSAEAGALLERLGDQLLPLFSSSDQGEAVRQAVVDMFSEPTSDAHRWLTEMGCTYVMMCSLGLEARSGDATRTALRGIQLVVDTDVALSLLCEAEANHEHVTQVLRAWRALGGRVLLSVPVLEELAYHAWISERDFEAMRGQLTKLSDEDAAHLIGNTFVRTFRKYVVAGSAVSGWGRYISQYRGARERDYGNVWQVLHEELGAEMLPTADEQYVEFQAEVKAYLVEWRTSGHRGAARQGEYRLEDKCRRDALILSAVRAAREGAARSGLNDRAVLWSSSRSLRAASGRFGAQLGQPSVVMSSASLACLLTFIPGVPMGLGSLRGVLFDAELRTRLSDVQRYAYRIIAASAQYDVPWSKRGMLQRELGQKMLAEARATGEPVKAVRRKIVTSQDPELASRVVAETLDSMAERSELEEENMKLREEVKTLRRELEEKRGA